MPYESIRARSCDLPTAPHNDRTTDQCNFSHRREARGGRRIPGVFIAEYEQGEIARDLFRVAL
jgi:hypothetical protein